MTGPLPQNAFDIVLREMAGVVPELLLLAKHSRHVLERGFGPQRREHDLRALGAKEGVAMVGQGEGVVHDAQLLLRVMLRESRESGMRLGAIGTKQVEVGVDDDGSGGRAERKSVRTRRDRDLA